MACYIAAIRDHSDVLAPGEYGTVVVTCPDKAQARTILRYVRGLLNASPLTAKMVVSDTAEGIELSNRNVIECHASIAKGRRGYSVLAAILDECAFLKSDESATPDFELVEALQPAMALIPNSLLLGISSPYGRHGILWDRFSHHYGKPGDVLVWRASSLRMNPTFPRRILDDAMARDEASARAEYLAEFKAATERLYAPDLLEAATDYDRPLELPAIYGVTYWAFCDLSAGSTDSATLAVAHEEDGRIILDLTREVWAPFAADAVVAEFVSVLREYGINQVWGDRYAGTWGQEPFEAQGIEYVVSGGAGDPMKLGTKSDLYSACLPLFTSGRVQLPNDGRLRAQFAGLERKTSRAGKDSVAKRIGTHDDVCNAAAGALLLAAQPQGVHLEARNLAPEGRGVTLSLTHDVPLTYEAEIQMRFRDRLRDEFHPTGRLEDV